MKIDFEKIKELTGMDFKGKYQKQDLLSYIQSVLYELKTHNKNYTKAQYERICMLYDFMNCIEIK